MTPFSFSHVLLLFGILQTVQLGVVLTLRGNANRAASHSLQALLGVCALLLIDYLLLMNGTYASRPGLAGFSLPLLFMLGPLLLGYVVCQTGGRPCVAWSWHGLPALLCAVLMLKWWALSGADKSAWLGATLRAGYDGNHLVPLAGSLLLCLQLVIYCYQADVVLERYDTALRQQVAGAAVHAVRWLKLVTRSFCIFQLLFYLSWAEWLYGGAASWHYTASAMNVLALLLITAGLWSQLRPELFQHGVLPVLGELPEPRYGRARLDATQLAACKEALQHGMCQQRFYLDPELRLHGLAEATGLSPHVLSQVINEGFGCNYFEYINRLRVAHAQNLLRQAPGGKGNLLEIALASGFNSKATFNRSFRQVTGMTPSAYAAAPGAQGLPQTFH